jgi:hypothetical protein
LKASEDHGSSTAIVKIVDTPDGPPTIVGSYMPDVRLIEAAEVSQVFLDIRSRPFVRGRVTYRAENDAQRVGMGRKTTDLSGALP